MKFPKMLIALAALAIATPARAQTKVDIRRAATPTVNVRLSGTFSNLKIIGWNSDSIALTGGVSAGNRLEGGPLNATGPVQGMKFFIETAEGASTANRLELRVPHRARVWIKTASAEIDCEAVTGGLDLNIVGGFVKVSGRPRELVVESMDGAITVTGDVGYGRLKTATGDITMNGSGEDLSFTTVSGTISLASPRAPIERARFESVTGPIVFAGSVTPGADVRFDTHSGAIDLRLPARATLEIDAQTMTGSIENTWNSGRPIAGREGRGMELGTGNGGGRVQVRSFKGNVRVTATK